MLLSCTNISHHNHPNRIPRYHTDHIENNMDISRDSWLWHYRESDLLPHMTIKTIPLQVFLPTGWPISWLNGPGKIFNIESWSLKLMYPIKYVYKSNECLDLFVCRILSTFWWSLAKPNKSSDRVLYSPILRLVSFFVNWSLHAWDIFRRTFLKRVKLCMFWFYRKIRLKLICNREKTRQIIEI